MGLVWCGVTKQESFQNASWGFRVWVPSFLIAADQRGTGGASKESKGGLRHGTSLALFRNVTSREGLTDARAFGQCKEGNSLMEMDHVPAAQLPTLRPTVQSR